MRGCYDCEGRESPKGSVKWDGRASILLRSARGSIRPIGDRLFTFL